MATFYRAVRTNPPTREDFMGNEARGITPRRPLVTDEQRRMWAGLSIQSNLDDARANARQHEVGAFIAQIDIPDGAPITYARTGRKPGHYTLWGEAGEIAGCVTAVFDL